MLKTSIDSTWNSHLNNILLFGKWAAPRGVETRYVFNASFEYDPLQAVILNQKRDLNYRFMMAEAYWILSGDDTVEGIAPWNSKIAQFSDDGRKFFGAYGPKIKQQMPYVIKALDNDWMTRQAVINIWRESPPKTKDVPCTLNIIFYASCKHGEKPTLHATVNMRSSDAWLGVPYDVFNFGMVLTYVAAALGWYTGHVRLNMVNAHLYSYDLDKAVEAVSWYQDHLSELQKEPVPTVSDHVKGSPERLMQMLKWARNTNNKAECLAKWRRQQ